jgi:hypothetical protein
LLVGLCDCSADYSSTSEDDLSDDSMCLSKIVSLPDLFLHCLLGFCALTIDANVKETTNKKRLADGESAQRFKSRSDGWNY